jgi:hypothetical protein
MAERTETRGRKPTYPDTKILRSRIDEYFVKCTEERQFADYAGMRLFLKLSKKDIDDMCSPEINGDKAYDYRDVFEWARDRRESLLVRQLVTQPKLAQGIRLALAMPENGGYSDKAVENQDRKVHIKVSEKDEELFK